MFWAVLMHYSLMLCLKRSCRPMRVPSSELSWSLLMLVHVSVVLRIICQCLFPLSTAFDSFLMLLLLSRGLLLYFFYFILFFLCSSFLWHRSSCTLMSYCLGLWMPLVKWPIVLSKFYRCSQIVSPFFQTLTPVCSEVTLLPKLFVASHGVLWNNGSHCTWFSSPLYPVKGSRHWIKTLYQKSWSQFCFS